MGLKRHYEYYAALEPCSDGYGVYFPDLPGAASGGVDIDAAALNAQECLALHLYGMEEDGDEIPLPSKREQIDAPEGVELILISVDMSDFYPEYFEEKS